LDFICQEGLNSVDYCLASVLQAMWEDKHKKEINLMNLSYGYIRSNLKKQQEKALEYLFH
jgi:hypothetical protein